MYRLYNDVEYLGDGEYALVEIYKVNNKIKSKKIINTFNSHREAKHELESLRQKPDNKVYTQADLLRIKDFNKL